MLVGSTYYNWELVTGETLRGRDGPVAIRTRLGCVLSGPAHSIQTPMLLTPSMSLFATHTLRTDADPCT